MCWRKKGLYLCTSVHSLLKLVVIIWKIPPLHRITHGLCSFLCAIGVSPGTKMFVSYYFSVATGWAERVLLWMSENGTAWGGVFIRHTEFYMLMKKEERLGQAGPEFRPWLPFPKIFTSSLFHPRFLSGMSIYTIASPFKLQFWEFACWLCQEWWRDASAPWLCCVVCYKACDIMWLSLWICSQQRVLWSK